MILRWRIQLIWLVSAAVFCVLCSMKSDNAQPYGRVSRITGDIVLVRRGVSTVLQRGEKLCSNDLLISKRGRATLVLYWGESYAVYPDSVTSLARHSTPVIDLVERSISRIKGPLHRLRDQADTPVIAVRG
jgi:hypothetical protein